MSKTVQRVLRATAAFACLVTAFATSGVALAATPGMTAPASVTSGDGPHPFAPPRSVRADNGSDGGSLPSPEHASSSDSYQDSDSPGYAENRRGKNELKHTEANHKIGERTCASAESSHSGGYNGEPARVKPNSDDYNPDCDGYHAPAGANRYDDDGYVGTSPGRANDNDYQFGGLL
jgi:hypothetical protein